MEMVNYIFMVMLGILVGGVAVRLRRNKDEFIKREVRSLLNDEDYVNFCNQINKKLTTHDKELVMKNGRGIINERIFGR